MTNEQAYKLGYFDGYFMGQKEIKLMGDEAFWYDQGYADAEAEYLKSHTQLKAA